MRLTPAILEATYQFLSSTPPFRGWKMPGSDDVEFHVVRFYHVADAMANPHVIRVSEKSVSHTSTLVLVMAHEMVHIHLDRKGERAEHGPKFRRAWRQVCKHHGFDPVDI